jgi:hypothetical protein
MTADPGADAGRESKAVDRFGRQGNDLMNVSDNSQDQYEGQKLNRPMNADAEDQPAQQEQATNKITSLNARQREQSTQPFTSSDEMTNQIERMEKLLEAQAKYLNDLQASLRDTIAEQLAKQSLKQEERLSTMLISFKEAIIEQRDQLSKTQASLLGAIIEQRDQLSKTQASLLGAIIEQRDQLSKTQASLLGAIIEQTSISSGSDNRGTTPILANQFGLNVTQTASSEQEQSKQVSISHITCMVALPFKDNADTFAYEGILLPALRDILERSPFYWEVIRADEIHLKDIIQENIKALMKKADAYIVDISDENPNVMMELGYMLWSKKDDQPLVVLKRQGTGGYLADIAGYFCKTYPATKALGTTGIKEVVETLSEKFRTHDGIKALQITKRPHYLSPIFLQKDVGMNDEFANKLSHEFMTMEAVEECPEEEYLMRTKDIQRLQAEGAKTFIIDRLKEIRARQ